MKVTSIIFIAGLFILTCYVCRAQPEAQTAPLYEAFTIENELTVELPLGFSAVSKKILRSNKPPTRIKKSIGYQHPDGSKFLLYLTKTRWNFSDVGLWDWMFDFSLRMFPKGKFLESGYYADSGVRGSDMYFIKIHDSNVTSNQCVLLTISKFTGTILLGVYTSGGDNYDTWAATSDELLIKHFIRSKNSFSAITEDFSNRDLTKAPQ